MSGRLGTVYFRAVSRLYWNHGDKWIVALASSTCPQISATRLAEVEQEVRSHGSGLALLHVPTGEWLDRWFTHKLPPEVPLGAAPALLCWRSGAGRPMSVGDLLAGRQERPGDGDQPRAKEA